MEGGGGKMGYGGGGGGHHETARLLKTLSRTVEPRNFGIGLVVGFLLVTCAYFSTANFDAIHIALMPSKNGIGSPVTASTAGSEHRLGPDLGARDQEDALSKQGGKAEVLDTDGDDEDGRKMILPSPSGPDASLGDTGKEGGAFAVDTGAPPNATAEGGGEGELLAKDGALLPPLSSPEESTNSTQEQGVLEDEELQVPDAIAAAAAANPSKKISGGSNGSSSPASVIPSDPATIPAPVQQIPTPPLELKAPPLEQIPPTQQQQQQQEVKANPVQRIPPTPEVKQTGSSSSEKEAAAARRPWKPLCDFASNRRIDWCELDGDVRVHGANGTVTLVGGAMAEEWRVKPYPRKADANAMRFVRELTVRSTPLSANADADVVAPACTDRHEGVPALVFSDRGYTGNYFHAYTDVILPLFLTAKQYSGEVQFLVSDFQMWWIGKFMPVFKSLSNYPLIDLAADGRVRCFSHVQVGLTCHGDFSIDPRRAPNGYSMVDFTRFMRRTYKLPRDLAVPINGGRPRLLIIARGRTRRFVNLDEIVRGAEKVGFEAVVSEGEHEVAPFAELANTCDAMLGVHGAGLTNMVFLPTGGAVIQVVPLGGLEFVAGYFRSPAADMGLRYLEYRIAPAESTLTEQYPPDHPIFTDPDGVKSKGWDSLKAAYLDKQDVRLDMRRFRPLLKKAFAHVRANNKKKPQ